jgi:amidase
MALKRVEAAAACGDDPHGVTRREFLRTGAAAAGALAAGAAAVLPASSAAAHVGAPWLEASISELQHLMASGQLTSRELTLGYLGRIKDLNPLLHAVIETSPTAVADAARLDNERRQRGARGPLHGIPILLKDNIATSDQMETTAGSLALVNSRVPGDAPIVRKLREAGAVILGKANLSEWANFRGFAPFNGWSARGGFTRDPYLLDFDPCGSSSGSAVAPAANLCAAAIGTETDGSIVCPAGNNLVVGLKPTLGLWSQDGIIPIAHSQDTAGPMCRTVRDAALLLGALRTPFGPVSGFQLPADYMAFLQRGSLLNKRIGIDRRYFTPDYGGEPDLIEVVEQGLEAMEDLGATLIDTDTGDPFQFFDAEFTVLLTEFKVQIAEYLSGLSHTSLGTLADLIRFNERNCRAEMKYFGQELFELSEETSGNLLDPDYLAARALCLQLTRTEGIDAALQRDHLDAIVAPSYSFASGPAAVAGYPNISLPIGLTPEGKPAGIWMYGGFLEEPRLLSMAYDLEQEIQPRSAPGFRGSVPEEPPDAGLCGATPGNAHVAGARRMPRHFGTGKLWR